MVTIDDLENIDGLPAKFLTVKLVNRGGGSNEVGVAMVITDLDDGAHMIGLTEEQADQAWKLLQRVTFRAESMNEELRHEQANG